MTFTLRAPGYTTMLTSHINPFSNQVRYTVGLMATHRMRRCCSPCGVASRSTEMVKSVVRHLCYEDMSILVENAEIQSAVAGSLGVEVGIAMPGGPVADAALFPLSLEEGMQPAGERTIVAGCYNALSYKSLLYPLSMQGTVYGKLARLKPHYHLSVVGALYSPRFVLWLALAKLLERRHSAWYFRLEDHAMHHFVESGALWRFSYIVVVTGRSTR